MGSRLEKKSADVRKRIENHTFDGEEGEEYNASNFGGFTDYFRRKKIKLQNLDVELRARSADKPQIFRGVVAHVNGYTQPSLNDLHLMLVAHGAGFVQYLDGKTMVTHIIASSLTPKKCVEFKNYRLVKPAWVVDSVHAGRLLPWDNYRVVDQGVGQKVLAFDNGNMVSQPNRHVKGYKEQSDTSWYTHQLRSQREASGPSHLPTASSGYTLTPGEENALQAVLDKSERDNDLAGDVDPGGDGVEEELHGPEDDYVFNEQDASILGSKIVTPDFDQPPLVDVAHLNPSDSPSILAQSRGTKRSRSSPSPSPSKAAKLTAEEHNTILLADPRIRKSTVVNPDFLEQYYRESRLHHLSTWKAELKSQLQALTLEKSSQKNKQKRKPGARRYIMHVDFDSFFAAVSLKKAPEFKDKPAVVAHGSGSGSEIASCNYPARKFGISNGMWMKRAQELCPDLKVLPYDFPAYEETSRKFYDAILATSGIVQSVSIDEALVDVSEECISTSGSDGVHRSEGSNFREQAKADEIARDLRETVFGLTDCNVSVGIGGNILQAKLALRKAKPAGQYQLKPDDVLNFIGGFEVQSLPGVAYSIAGKLEEIGIKYVKDIRETSKDKLIRTLGPKTGEKIYEYARGIDRTEVGDQVVRKSVSAEVNWGVRFENQEQVDDFIQSLCGELHKRLLKENVKGRQLTVKVLRRSPDAPLDPPKHLGHGKCDTYNRSLQLGIATNDANVISKEALATMRGFGFTPGELRGIGVQMTKLEPIKAALGGRVDGSQKRLQFQFGIPTEPKIEPQEDPITDDIETPKKQRIRDVNQSAVPFSLLNSKSPSRRPLNTLGTQFVLPTQVDPKVLAELPEDIRAKLTRQMDAKATFKTMKADDSRKADNQSPASSPPPAASAASSPAAQSPSDNVHMDAGFLDSLPEDIRAEVEAMYLQRSPRKQALGSLSLLRSPRKNRTTPAQRKPVSRKRGGLASRSALKSKPEISTLTQANFIARPRYASPDITTATDTEDDHGDGDGVIPDLDADFLASLPQQLRQEVVDQHRAQHLRRTGGIEVSSTRSRILRHPPQQQQQQQKPQQHPENTIEAYFLPPPPQTQPSANPKFMKKYSELPDLRRVIKAWVIEFKDERPYPEDVAALCTYLEAVVTRERNLAKAAKVVKWVSWVVSEEVSVSARASDEVRARKPDAHGDDAGGFMSGTIHERNTHSQDKSRTGQTLSLTPSQNHAADEDQDQGQDADKSTPHTTQAWAEVLATLKRAVQDAAAARGLGPLDLD